MSPKDIVDALKKDAEAAATYNAELEKLLAAVVEVDRRLVGMSTNNIGLGVTGFVATVAVTMKHGHAFGNNVVIPDPTFTRERFLYECASIYDALDNYYGAIKKEQDDEANRRPSRT
jgi:hypothetical protein